MSKNRVSGVFLVLISIGIICGCGNKVSHMPAPDFDGKSVRLIATMPIDNKTGDIKAGQVLRHEVLEEIYFKGYPKIPVEVIDETLIRVYGDKADYGNHNELSRDVGNLLNVDALMYCTLNTWETSYKFVYACITVSASFELVNAKTGETLWKSNYKKMKSCYDFTENRLALKSSQAYEPAAQEVLRKTFSTFPNGPDYIEKAAAKKKSLWGLW